MFRRLIYIINSLFLHHTRERAHWFSGISRRVSKSATLTNQTLHQKRLQSICVPMHTVQIVLRIKARGEEKKLVCTKNSCNIFHFVCYWMRESSGCGTAHNQLTLHVQFMTSIIATNMDTRESPFTHSYFISQTRCWLKLKIAQWKIDVVNEMELAYCQGTNINLK